VGATLVLGFVALGVTMLLSGFTSRALLIQLSQNAVFDLRMRLSRQILGAPLLYLEKCGAPRLLASLIDDVMALTGTLLGIPAFCINVATILVCLLYLGLLSWEVLLAALFFMALGAVSYHLLLTRALRYLQMARQQQNKLFADFRALTQGTKELKLHRQRREEFLGERLRTTAADSRRFNIRGSRIYAGADGWGQFLFFVFIGLMLFALPLLRETTSQMMVGYTLALLYIMAPLEVLLNFIPNIGRAQIALRQIESLGLSLSQAATESEETPSRTEPASSWERLELSGVAHTYRQEQEDESFVLGPIDLTIEAGETVFLIGGNGSGKTTLLKLITGLYAPEAGEIYLGGQLIDGTNREWYRSHFSVVFSDFYLFESLLGLSDADTDEVAAAYLARLHLEHKVKVEDGVFSTLDLSQGQRKRLALLTALLEDRSLYVFDEWAADQDPIFKDVFYKEFLPALKAQGKTVLVITHDDRYYHLADRLIKLDYGKLVPPAAVQISSPVVQTVSPLMAQPVLPSIVQPVVHGETSNGSNTSNGANIRQRGDVSQRPTDSDDHSDKIQKDKTLNERKPLSLKASVGRAVAAALFVAVVGLIALYGLKPPPPAPAESALESFSAARARKHLAVIASRAHPIGSPAQAEVRAYLLAELARLGLTPELHPATAVDNFRGEFRAGTAQNIVAQLPGAENRKKIALVCHYDSVPYGPGAGDDGAGVAALLETVRALKSGPPLKNGLVILFTDGEEELMLGARAFRAEDPLLKEVTLALNFEARGTNGPSMMFETSENNGWLIEQFAAAAPYKMANSLSYEIYRLLPNATDMTIFREAGLSGLNFAFIGGLKNYHTSLDTLENLDDGSLQHHGSYALALARHFGDANLDSIHKPNAVYFNTWGTGFVFYPVAWAVPLVILSALAFAVVLWVGRRQKVWSALEIAIGALGMLAALLLSVAIVWLVWLLGGQLRAAFGSTPQIALYKNHLFGVVWVALSTTVFVSAYNILRRRVGPLGLVLSGLSLWLVMLGLSALLVPGGSYLFTWPLLCGLLGLGWVLWTRDTELSGWRQFIVLCLCAAPAILLFIPLISLIHQALALDSFIAVALLSALLGLGLLPQLHFITAPKRWLAPCVAAVVALVCLAIGVRPPAYDRQSPRPYHLFHAQNADTGKAIWASIDSQPDEWTQRFLSQAPQRGSLIEYLPSNYKGFAYQTAPSTGLAAPNLTLLEDQTVDGVRNLRIRISSSREAPVTYLFADPQTQILRATLRGKQIDYSADPPPAEPLVKKLLTYHAIPKEGIEIALQTKPGAPIRLIAMDQSYGLPEAAVGAQPDKPDHLMPLSFTYSDSSLVVKSFVF
jgi:putative ATP-binding cassette transporter